MLTLADLNFAVVERGSVWPWTWNATREGAEAEAIRQALKNGKIRLSVAVVISRHGNVAELSPLKILGVGRIEAARGFQYIPKAVRRPPNGEIGVSVAVEISRDGLIGNKTVRNKLDRSPIDSRK